MKLLSRLFCFSFFKIFINIDRDRGGSGLARSWSSEKLPVKSSAVNCPDTFDQDCRCLLIPHSRNYSLEMHDIANTQE